MKKTYEKPHLEVVELRYQKALLLPASVGGYTDENLAPFFDSSEDLTPYFDGGDVIGDKILLYESILPI
jgi:hypothetical protein